jgi:steroid delta-isomerase-like uncharacterized protein
MAADLKQLSRRWFEEVWNQGSDRAIDELLAPDGIAHGLGGGGKSLQGPQHFREFWRRFRGAFPDLRVRVEDVIAEGDKTAVRFSFEGTHAGDHLGLPRTHKKVLATAMSFIRWRDGKIIEGWNEFDESGMLRQLGALPSQPARLE